MSESDPRSRPCVSYWVNVNTGAWPRVYVNDVPLYRSPFVGPDSRSGPLNYLLRPGENTLKIELLKTGTPNPGTGDKQLNAVIFQVFITNNLDAPQTEKLDREILLDVRYPEIWDEAKQEHQHFPLYHEQSFELNMDLATPVFFNAPEAQFECEGTPELRQSVQRIYDLLEQGDYEAFLDELALKFASDQRAHAGDSDRLAGVRMQQWREELLRYEPKPNEPLDFSKLHFEPRRNGQVAIVTRHDDGFALEALCELDPKRRIITDLFMVQHQGRWRVFA